MEIRPQQLHSQSSDATLLHGLPHRRRRARQAQRGSSLIEIMVVLVILLIGVFLAIRIFPTGFATLRSSENRTSATRLSQRMLSLAKGDAAENLPQGVLAAYKVTDPSDSRLGQLVVDTNQDPDDLGEYTKGSPNSYFDDVNHFHYIKGEQVKIPLPTAGTVNGKNGSAYTLKFGPIYMDTTVGKKTTAPTPSNIALYNSYLTITGSPLTPISGQTSDTNAYLRLRGPQTYVVDYGGDDTTDPAAVMFAPRAPAIPARSNPNRYFVVAFSYVDDSSGEVRTVSDYTLPAVPDSATAMFVTLTDPNDGSKAVHDVIPGTIVVTRAFDRVGYNDTWDSADPYQYKLASDNINDGAPTPVYTIANIGALEFNPAGANYSESTPYGQRAFTAFIDYAVLDWHIIRDDIEVPSITLGATELVPLQTSLRPIKQSGDPQPDTSIYTNIWGDPNPNDIDSIVVLNLSDPTARKLNVGSYRKPQPTDEILVDDSPRGGSYQTGTIYVNTKLVSRGSQLRVLYKADGDWAVTLQKAYGQYRNPLFRSTTTTSLLLPQTRPPKNSYDQFGIDRSPATAAVYFPFCDLNKSVSLSIEYQLAADDPKEPNAWRRLDPVQVTLDKPVTENDPSDATKPLKYAVADINPSGGTGKSYIPTAYQAEFNSAQQWRVAGVTGTGVAYGTSVKARVIWHDVDTTSTRYRVQDLDSNLTPAP